MSNTVKMEQIKDYLSRNPPKVIKTRVLDYDKLIGVKGFFYYLAYTFGLSRKNSQYEDIAGRITESLPDEGEVILSDPSTIIGIFDETKHELVEAKYDINQGQIVPISSEVIELNGFHPSSQLSIKYFFDRSERWGKGKKATASFLEIIIRLSDVPLLELGRHKGYYSSERYLPVRKYKKK